jgi:class 3 adenylate cyclase
LRLRTRDTTGTDDERAGTRVILVTDLVASTTLNDRLGDRAYVTLLLKHDEIIRRRLAQYDGVEFKHTGDGIGAWFFSVNGALRCAIALQEDFTGSRSDGLMSPLRVKIALTAGEPTQVDGDLLGLSVTLAFRVVDLAEPGEVLVTSDVVGVARGLPWSFEALGNRQIKGMQERIDLFRARVEPDP